MESIQVRTADGVRLVATHVTSGRSADDGPEPGLAVVLAHGFTVSTRKPSVRRAMARVARAAGVVAIDFRGHGRSGGRTSVGARPIRIRLSQGDVEARMIVSEWRAGAPP